MFVTGSGLGVDNTFKSRFAVSADGGRTWKGTDTIGVPPGRSGDSQLVPQVGVAPNGRLDVAYYDLAEPSGSEDIYVTSSTDRGAHFSAPLRVTDTASDTTIKATSGGFGNDPFSVGHLLVATSNRSYIAWTDSRRGTKDTSKEDIFFAVTQPA